MYIHVCLEYLIYIHIDYLSFERAGTRLWSLPQTPAAATSVAMVPVGMPENKTTKNAKDDRKVDSVQCAPVEAVFRIPDGLDLESETVVESWTVKLGTLHIYYANGEDKQIEWVYGLETDLKFAQETTIEDADVYCIEYEADYKEKVEKEELQEKKRREAERV